MNQNEKVVIPSLLAVFSAYIVTSLLLIYAQGVLLASGQGASLMESIFYFPNNTRWVMALVTTVPAYYVARKALFGVCENEKTKRACFYVIAACYAFNLFAVTRSEIIYPAYLVCNGALALYAIFEGSHYGK